MPIKLIKMFRRSDSNPVMRGVEYDNEKWLNSLNPSTKFNPLKDGTLANIAVNTNNPIDIRYINCGALRWNNSAYNKLVKAWGLKLRDVKNWESIAKTGMIDIEEQLKMTEMIMQQVEIEKSLPNGKKRIIHEAINIPKSPNGIQTPLHMTQTYLPQESIVITEFVLIADFLNSLPAYIIDEYSSVKCCYGTCGCGCQ